MSTLPKPEADSLAAKVARAISPGYSYCLHCGTPWTFVEPHDTQYAPHRYCFALCEGCWSRLTVDERLPFYERMVFVIWNSSERWPEVRAAVLAEP